MQKFTKWVAMYGNAMSIADHKPETYSRDITLRYPIYSPFDGNKLRFTFDNFCADEDITITEAFVAMAGEDKGQIKPSTSRRITFSGKNSVSVGGGSKVVSDEIPMDVKRNDIITVSFYLEDFTLMRSSVIITGSHSGGFYSVGNTVRDEIPDINKTRKTNCYYFLSDIDILTEKENHALICYGDSITSQDWPDCLTDRLEKEGITNLSVIRKAASGTRILREYDNITYESYGLKGTNRVPREWDVSGADMIIIQQGINDIIHPVGTDVNPFRPMSDLPECDELINGFEWYISQSRKKNFRVYTGTLLPINGWRTYADFREKLKNDFNDWLRTTTLSDGCIDFDRAVRSVSEPSRFADGNDSGDHLHPSADGYKAMAECVPKEILQAPYVAYLD
ncbi:MAG: lipase [Ruminococcus sp.]|nr:lipase [Ruminococcus sp.]